MQRDQILLMFYEISDWPCVWHIARTFLSIVSLSNTVRLRLSTLYTHRTGQTITFQSTTKTEFSRINVLVHTLSISTHFKFTCVHSVGAVGTLLCMTERARATERNREKWNESEKTTRVYNVICEDASLVKCGSAFIVSVHEYLTLPKEQTYDLFVCDSHSLLSPFKIKLSIEGFLVWKNRSNRNFCVNQNTPTSLRINNNTSVA